LSNPENFMKSSIPFELEVNGLSIKKYEKRGKFLS
jgi:hypothetical protein